MAAMKGFNHQNQDLTSKSPDEPASNSALRTVIPLTGRLHSSFSKKKKSSKTTLQTSVWPEVTCSYKSRTTEFPNHKSYDFLPLHLSLSWATSSLHHKYPSRSPFLCRSHGPLGSMIRISTWKPAISHQKLEILEAQQNQTSQRSEMIGRSPPIFASSPWKKCFT